MTVVSVY